MMSGPFATAEEFSELTGLSVDRSRAQRWLGAASDLVRGYCGQTLSKVVGDVEVLPASESSSLLLSERPVTAVTSVVVSGTTLAGSTYVSERWGLLTLVSGATWNLGATVTYNHGYTETDWEWGVLRGVVMDVAARGISLNERSASEALGSTLMESAGFSPEAFLTEGEKARLALFGPVMVG